MRPGFDPWVGKIPWRGERLPTPVFWPGEFRGLYSPWGHEESDKTEQLSLSLSSHNDGASLVTQTVNNLLAVQETWVRSLGQEDPMEKGVDTHSSIPAWRIPWTEEPGGLQSMGSQNQAQLSG